MSNYDTNYEAVYHGIYEAYRMASYAAECTEELRQRPHVLLRVAVYPDGNEWCALYGTDLVHGVCGFGATPAAACADFDQNWISHRPGEGWSDGGEGRRPERGRQ